MIRFCIYLVTHPHGAELKYEFLMIKDLVISTNRLGAGMYLTVYLTYYD